MLQLTTEEKSWIRKNMPNPDFNKFAKFFGLNEKMHDSLNFLWNIQDAFYDYTDRRNSILKSNLTTK